MTPLGKKKSSSTDMAEDRSKVDPKNIIDAQYDDVLEDQRQVFEIKLKELEADSRKRLISCYGKTQQGVIEKEKFVMPTFSSTASFTSTDASTEVTHNVSDSSSSVILEQVKNLLAEKDVHLVKLLSSREWEAAGKQPKITNDSPSVANTVTSEVPISLNH